MERPVFKPVGTPIEELDTPALVIDLDALEHNLATVHDSFARREAALRPDMGAHLCPAIASKQLAAGGTVGGVAVSTVGEAKVFAQDGIRDILIAGLLVTEAKIQAACGIAAASEITLVAERADVIGRMSDAASDRGVSLRVLVQVRTTDNRPGVGSAEEAVTLARAITDAAGLRFGGLFANGGSDDRPDSGAVNTLRTMRDGLKAAGFDAETVCLASNDESALANDGGVVTEVVSGVYALMDHNHSTRHLALKHAARLLTTIITRPEPDVGWLDTGQKAGSVDTGLPVIDGVPGATLTRMSAEHGGLSLEGDAQGALQVGSKVWLIPADIANVVNLYDYVYAAQGGKLAATWEVAVRGRYR